jgi:hypothetical protein
MTPCLRDRLFTLRDRLFGAVTPEPRETPTPLRPSVTASTSGLGTAISDSSPEAAAASGSRRRELARCHLAASLTTLLNRYALRSSMPDHRRLPGASSRPADRLEIPRIRSGCRSLAMLKGRPQLRPLSQNGGSPRP